MAATVGSRWAATVVTTRSRPGDFDEMFAEVAQKVR
jgi:hypothetical protein